MLVIFEGLDNCGKTTLVEMIKDYYLKLGIDAEISKLLETTPISLNLTTVNLYLFTKAVLVNNKKDVESYKKQIEKYIDALSNNHKATFYDFYAMFLFNSGLYEEAIIYLDKALYYVTDNGLKGYIFYHYGYVYSETYQCLQAYEYYQKSLVIFNETNNYVKVVYTYITLADIYNRMKCVPY